MAAEPSTRAGAARSRSLRGDAAAELTPQRLAELRAQFEAKPVYTLMQNAVTETSVDDVALRRSVVTGTDHTFSHRLDDWSVTHQKKSGRCWIFAGLNLFRVGAMKKMNLKDFEFSQNHVLFWDKLGKVKRDILRRKFKKKLKELET